MMHTTVSVRGQTVIPYPIRQALGITAATQLQWTVQDRVILVMPIPPDPVRAAIGILRGRGPTTQDLETERRIQR